ncbi:MAG TPA: DUF222 domain-containing protein, partial [Jatrophihabitans sp.]|nr:DUF222 domain-containing protein [Jatrophihabitans sp.]
AVTSAALANLITALAAPSDCGSDAERIDRIRHFEDLKAAVAAAQARETAALVASQRRAQRARGVPAARATRGIAAQVALARRISPHAAHRYTGWATILTSERPATFAALQAGRTTEWRAMLVARETGWLSREHRARVDRQLAGRLESLGDRRTEAEAKQAAYRLDPHGYLARIRGAETDRRVTLRPAPDLMARLSALLPVTAGVATYAALTAAADRLIAAGDPRRAGQLMADLLVERVTGQAAADDVPVEINLVMTDTALLGSQPLDADPADSEPTISADPAGSDRHHTDGRDTDSADVDGTGTDIGGVDGAGIEPAYLAGYGPVPGAWARDLVLRARPEVPMWLRRLYLRPKTGDLAALESTRRTFTGNQRRYLQLRDQTCRTPWCEAPIRHIDHLQPHQHGGPTATSNGAGACVTCNHARQAPDWTATVLPGTGRHTIEITTPTGHRYRSRAPDLPGAPPTPAEERFAQAILAAA